MNILLLGAGGREHAFAWKISQSPLCTKLYIAPGNGGTMQYGTNIELDPTDFEGVKKSCVDHAIGMVIVGPEEPLVKGIVDFLKNDEATRRIPIIGPNKEAAQLEGSKAFSKRFMERHGIPTAAYREFELDNYAAGSEYIMEHALPVVIKADGLAAGKGVIICNSHVEAMAEYELMLQHNKFGDAAKKIVVEEFLNGIEMSVFILTDGNSYVILPEAKDYKKVGEGDRGVNTGGMGAVSPVPFADDVFMEKVKHKIIDPTMAGLKREGIQYIGFIFIGVIKVGEEPFVIEYNCRMGDPESEVVLPRIKNDLLFVLQSVVDQRLHEITLDIDERVTGTIVATSMGYPGSYEKGLEIRGIGTTQIGDSLIFQAGTLKAGTKILTNGGRVLCVTSYADTLFDAIEKSKEILSFIDFDGMYYRRDIGFEFL